jgi:hypothetical protein
MTRFAPVRMTSSARSTVSGKVTEPIAMLAPLLVALSLPYGTPEFPSKV